MSAPIDKIALAARSMLAGVVATKYLPADRVSALALVNVGVSFALAAGVSREELTAFFAEMLTSAEKVYRLLKVQEPGMVSLDEALAQARAACGKRGN